ncbi:MAG: quinone oxidoreductase, partial [Proteobacteria bacterium]
HAAIGINYIDIYHRSGVYPMTLPAVLGLEAAGTAIAVGPGVTRIRPGDRVAYAGGPPGAYAEQRVMDEARLIVLPSGVDAEQAASVMFSGLTVQFLLRQVYPVKAGDVVLIHAAAGKVGLLLCQWAKHLGATVIGTVGSDAKAELVNQNGCDFPIVYTREKVAESVARITGGAKANVVYDSVGRDTLADSLDSLRPKGMLVSFGVASGETPPLDLRLLLSKGSLFVTRPSFGHYMGELQGYRVAADEMLALVGAGALRVITNHRFPLREAATAHRTLEARQTTGACLLMP